MTIKKCLAMGVVIAAITVPLISSAQTTASSTGDLASQIQSLLDQIHSLQQQLKTLLASSGASSMMGSTTKHFMSGENDQTPPPGQMGKQACITLNRNLGVGSRGDDVMKLQQMLADDPESEFEGTATGFFGPRTAKAMMMFQMHMGIASSTTGAVGPLTRGFFERSCGKGLENEHEGMMNGGGFSGTITANGGSSITIQNKQGASRVVYVSASTTIQVWVSATSSPATGSITDLVVGDMALAEGTPGSDGSINATHIKVGPAMPPPPRPEDTSDWKNASSTDGQWHNLPPSNTNMMGHGDSGGYGY